MSFIAVAAIGAGGALLGGVVGAVGANAAADTQASAAESAAQLQAQTANNSLLYQGALSNAETTNQQPWYESGEGALAQLDSMMGVTPGAPASGVNVPSLGIGTSPGNPSGSSAGAGEAVMPGQQPTSGQSPQSTFTNGQDGMWQQQAQTQSPGGTAAQPIVPGAPASTPSSQFQAATPGAIATDANGNPTGGAATSAPLMQGWNQTFQAPTAAEAAATPGEQYMVQQAQLAGNMSAAASGNLLTGGTAKALENNAEGMASTSYGNAYNQALEGYDTNFNTFSANQANQYNRMAALAGVGQTSASSINANLANTGTTEAGIAGNAALQIGQQGNNAAAATASGYVGGANAISGGLSGMGSTLSNYGMLQTLLNQSQNGGITPYPGGGGVSYS